MGDVIRVQFGQNLGEQGQDEEKAKETVEAPEPLAAKYDTAEDKAKLIILNLRGQEINKRIYDETRARSQDLTLDQAAWILDNASKDGIKKKPAYYKAIAMIFLDLFTEWTKTLPK